jgi:hypothetical protein
MRLFDKSIDKYKMLLEADDVNAAQAGAPAPPAPAGTSDTPPPPAPPVQKQPSSPAFAAITQTILDAFKTKPKLNKYTGMSNTKITNENVYKFLQIIQSNLPTDAQKHFNKNFGKGSKTPVEGNDLIDMVTIALKALYDVDKSPQEPEYADISRISEVTVENAKEIYDKIVNVIGLNSKYIP